MLYSSIRASSSEHAVRDILSLQRPQSGNRGKDHTDKFPEKVGDHACEAAFCILRVIPLACQPNTCTS